MQKRSTNHYMYMYVNQVPDDFTEVQTMATCYRALKDILLPILTQVFQTLFSYMHLVSTGRFTCKYLCA